MENWIPDLPGYTMPEPPTVEGLASPTNNSPNAGKNSALEQGVNIPQNWKPTLDKPLPVVRCTGTVRNGDRQGERCGRWSIMGHDRCMVHGAQLPNVQKAAATKVEAAKLRLIEDADLAIDTLFELLKPGTAAQVQLGAAKEILDRAGVRGGTELSVEVHSNVSAADEIKKKLSLMAERMGADTKQAEEDLEDLGEAEVAEPEED